MEDLKKLFASFENIGDNCEFGIAQRVAGIEPLGLFRFAGTAHLPSLTAAFESDLESFGEPDDVELFGANGGYYGVHIKSFHVIYATTTRLGAQKQEVVLNREIARISFLKRKLIEDLADGHKILVRKGLRDNFTQIQALSAALRGFGPNMLLWVTEADREHPNGSLEVLTDGILAGRINQFAPPENVPNLVFDDWVALCRRCFTLLRRG